MPPQPSNIGNPDLQIESAKSIEAGLRRAVGPLRFEATAYYTRFNGFIFRQITGVFCDETFASCGAPDAELNQAVYSQRDAIFRGGEFQSQLDVAPLWAACGAWRTSSTSSARPSPTAPTCAHPAGARGRRRVLARLQLADCASICCTPSRTPTSR
jgi:outer membrane receptor protein involved in Fe transport